MKNFLVSKMLPFAIALLVCGSLCMCSSETKKTSGTDSVYDPQSINKTKKDNNKNSHLAFVGEWVVTVKFGEYPEYSYLTINADGTGSLVLERGLIGGNEVLDEVYLHKIKFDGKYLHASVRGSNTVITLPVINGRIYTADRSDFFHRVNSAF